MGMENKNYLVALVGGLGVVLTVAYTLEEMLESGTLNGVSKLKIAFLLAIKSVLGAILIVLVYFSLSELNIAFTVFGTTIKFGTFTNLFISSIICLWGSDFYRFSQKLFKKQGGVEC